jgi:ABC-type multidrug transport system ATPase subunit
MIIILVLIAIILAYLLYAGYTMYYKNYTEKKRSAANALARIQESNSIDEDTFSVINVVDEHTSLMSKVELKKQNFHLDLKFNNLGLVLRSNGQRVLQSVTGEMKSGQLTCVLGASGAGKSTFITTLASRAYYGIEVGEILINGKPGSLRKYNRSVGFVPQEDIMLREMTVEETLYFAARTRSDWRLSRSEIRSIVDNVINVLKLNSIRHSIIGDEENRGISGGQRKRVNVAMELVSQPLCLLCDEPTSGLDSASSKELCEALNDIAHAGVNVIAVIHQPRYEIFHMFEQVLLLGYGGRTVYIGSVDQVEAYFESLGYQFPKKGNPADYLLDITTGSAKPIHHTNKYSVSVTVENLPDLWEEYTANNQQQQQEPRVPEAKYRSPSYSGIIQFFSCLQRSIVQQMRSIPSILLDLFLVCIGGLIIAISTRGKTYVGPIPVELQDTCPSNLRGMCSVPLEDPITGTTMMFNLALSLTGAMASLRCFGKERVVYSRESESGLRTISYFIAKDLAMLPLTLLAPLIFLSVFYMIQAPRAAFIEYYYSALLIYWTAYGFGYFISVVLKPNLAQLAAVVMIVIMFALNGVTPKLPDYKKMSFPLNALPYTSFLFYGQQVVYLLEIRRYKHLYDITASLDAFGYKLSELTRNTCLLLVFGVGFRLLALIFMYLTKPNNIPFRIYSWFLGLITRNISNKQ